MFDRINLETQPNQRQVFTMALSHRLMSKRLWILVFLVVLAGIILEIWAVNRLVTFGEKISQTEQMISNIKLENQILKNKIAESSSLNKVKTYSSQLGFDNIKKLEYIKDDVVIPANSLTINAF